MTYPLFQPLKMEHKAMFDKAFKDNLSEISEFTFTNLYSWRHAYGFEISLFGSLIILRSASKGSGYACPEGKP